MMDSRPIGIIDSGVGGLSIWKEITLQLPDESTIYLADSLNCPYGTRLASEIYNLATKLIKFLVSKDVKLIVIACNTITVSCLSRLRLDFPEIPIVGTVPVVKTATLKTKNNRIGILSTTLTSQSDYQKNLISQFASNKYVVNVGTDLLVPLVEDGELSDEKVITVLEKELSIFKKEGVDVLALGCSHFPHLREQVQGILGRDVLVLDSGGAIARQVKRILEKNKELNKKGAQKHLFYTTGDKSKFKKALSSLVGYNADRDLENIFAISL